MSGRILVVDDVATNRIVLKVKLAAACYDVLQAEGGEEALRLAQAERPDLILLDFAMPDLDGVEVCRRLKADPATADIPVIMVTAYDDTAAKLAALEAGAEEFLSKPLDDLRLLARVRSALRARSIAAELALREGTQAALGFSEPASTFETPSRIALIPPTPATGIAWRGMLAGRLRHRIEVMSRAEALAARPAPDVFVIGVAPAQPMEGLLLLSELRSRAETRHAGILVVLPEAAREPAAMALDMGASDLMGDPPDPQELALRLKTQVSRKKQADRLRARLRDGLQMAVTDPLTGLHNRRYGLSHLAQVAARARKDGRSYAVMLVDLDRFKTVNDRYGHATGDAVLTAVARRLAASLRSVDLVARIGGEEFLVVMPEISAPAAQAAAERLRRAVADTPIEVPGGGTLTQTVSIGVAIGGGEGARSEESEAEVLDRADRALYRAKAAGRDRITFGPLPRSAA